MQKEAIRLRSMAPSRLVMMSGRKVRCVRVQAKAIKKRQTGSLNWRQCLRRCSKAQSEPRVVNGTRPTRAGIATQCSMKLIIEMNASGGTIKPNQMDSRGNKRWNSETPPMTCSEMMDQRKIAQRSSIQISLLYLQVVRQEMRLFELSSD